MAQQARTVGAVLLGPGRATPAAAGAGERTFHCQNEFVGPRDLGLEDAYIRNVARDRNEWLIRHAGSSLVSNRRFGWIMPQSRMRRNHYM